MPPSAFQPTGDAERDTRHSNATLDTPLGRVDAYLTSLDLSPKRQSELRAHVAAASPTTAVTAIEKLHEALAGDGDDQAEAALATRIETVYPRLAERRYASGGAGYRGASMPQLERYSMSPARMDRRPWRFLARLMPSIERRRRLPRAVPSRLRSIVRLRQVILFLLVALPAAGATLYMLTTLPHHGQSPLEAAILVLASLLFAWILVGFWNAVAGFFLLWRGDKHLVSAAASPAAETPARTAIVMPIYEEAVPRTFAGLTAVFESLQRTGRLDEFDFFVLSDSITPDTIAAEEHAWAETCRSLGAFDRLFYRRRRARVKRKSGNLADFCRRWRGHYRYMIVLDADSLMFGATLTALVDRMQANPGVGLIQTPPIAVNRSSFLARVQQFATGVYSRMFAAGLHYWHLDNAHYWGHNAIIRIAPFMAHCALPRLSGRGALSGDIMSHDFVEAALMRRAGWGVHIAYDLPGSYEEVPPTLIEELGRDQRWCKGNIQHLRLLFSDNLAPAHRALFANGVMAYTSAAIWFVFLVLSSTEAILRAVTPPNYFPKPGELFPAWPIWQPFWALSLFCMTLVVLFLPKVLGMALIIIHGRQRDFGGVVRLIGSTLIEIVLTSFLAPVRMLSHTLFVVTTLLGKQVKWNSQQRADAQVPWLAAIRFHLPGMLLAAAWGTVLYHYTPGFFPWLLPILAPLFFAPVMTVVTSRVDIGLWLRHIGLELIPEEWNPPTELRRVIELEPRIGTADFADLVVDPVLSALHIGLQGSARRLHPDVASYRDELAERALDNGPASLSRREQCDLLADPQRLAWLHRALWGAGTLPDWAIEPIRRQPALRPVTASAV